jgi:cobyrinic acid a,c-diamide synthase
MNAPGLVVAALRGGSGKTILSIGIIAALQARGLAVSPFKKGPDYIDAGWLALAAGRPCYNLDTFLIESSRIVHSYRQYMSGQDIAVIEGNRGLYDCINTAGRTSTAELAKLLSLPVFLCLDCTKSTRTQAAVVSGLAQFDPDVKIGGVILNRVAGSRHESILRASIEEHCRIPVVGAIPKLHGHHFPERHMGLVPTIEHDWAADAIESARDMAEKHIDLDLVVDTARAVHRKQKKETREQTAEASAAPMNTKRRKPRIGVIRDSAFQFYYAENLEALTDGGAELVFTSPLKKERLPDIDALYIGGGFPETHAAALAENHAYREQLRNLADAGLPIYAECGGLMYLGQELFLGGATYPMTGVFPIVFGFSKRPQGHGYTLACVEAQNPYYRSGSEIRGHEFHYSKVLHWGGSEKDLVFRMDRGNGIVNGRDGAVYRNVLATYSHVHAHGTRQWAEAMLRNATLCSR